MRSSDSKLAAVQRAYDAGHPEVALMILAGKVRAYTRSPKSRPGWQVSDYRNPYPPGTVAVVLVDAYGTGKPDGYYVVPIAEIRKIIMDDYNAAHPDGVRPVSPEATHAVVTPESVEQYRDAWRLDGSDATPTEPTRAKARPKAAPKAPSRSESKAELCRIVLRAIESALDSIPDDSVVFDNYDLDEAAAAIAAMVHHFPAGRNPDGSRWWTTGTLPRPDRSEWR